ncbi:hypothetical protein SAMN06265365_101430 [Tistlia consotensis]|uniref:Uncharacterized protein n=1 Tax=Tistlia consotensis USBA 355 TaxID=560819 RepID=A0A1Y6B5L0_9PROT|nr:hypothetical protein [Tistlia consotensis]SME91697.1 hypothetical protein SAMN05428998_101428 [Tistlia consotensis USBA 355]SNR27546.1 hypothetical protein SAMN06265365_101430 [Tistlia consotensis]
MTRHPATRRLCRKCHAELGVDDSRCEACGASNPVPVPWYTPILGLAIVALLFLLLVDFSDVAKVLGFE